MPQNHLVGHSRPSKPYTYIDNNLTPKLVSVIQLRFQSVSHSLSEKRHALRTVGCSPDLEWTDQNQKRT
jgi:hypothetical protein